MLENVVDTNTNKNISFINHPKKVPPPLLRKDRLGWGTGMNPSPPPLNPPLELLDPPRELLDPPLLKLPVTFLVDPRDL